MSNFSKFLTNKGIATGSTTERVLNAFSNHVATVGRPFQGSQFAGLESLDEVQRQSIDQDASDLEKVATDLGASIASENGTDEEVFTEAQRTAAVAASMVASDPEGHSRAVSERVVAPADATLVPSDSDAVRREVALESYDDGEMRNTMKFSFAYNLKAARQDEFGEALFPTIVAAPTDTFVTVTANLIFVTGDFKHKVGDKYQRHFGAQNVIRSLIDPEILQLDSTRCYPVYRDSDDTNNAFFVSSDIAAASSIVLESGERVKTAPLKMGKRANLLALSATDLMLEQGVFNPTDQLDRSAKLGALYVKVGDAVVAFRNLDLLHEATFTPSQNLNDRMLNLNFNVTNIAINKDTKAANGGAITGLEVINTSDLTVNLSMNVSGTLDINTGWIQLSAGEISVDSVYDATGTEQDLGSGNAKTIATAFGKATVEGYDLIVRRANLNRRETGQYLDMTIERMVYPLDLLGPVTARRPAIERGDQDAARIDMLVMHTHARCSASAVKALLRVEDYLSKMPANHRPSDLYSQTTLGAARFFLKPWYAKADVNVKEHINSLRSADHVADAQAVLVNIIREFVYRAHYESGYKAASDALFGPGAKKPVAVIATDPYIANFLMVHGDWRTLGNEFNVKIVSTNNKEMKGKIRIVFGKADGTRDDLSNPLHFGNMVWRPELTSNLVPITRDGTVSREMTVQPSATYIPHCPIMGAINVTGLKEAVSDRLPVITQTA